MQLCRNIESKEAGFTEAKESCSEWYEDSHVGSITAWIEEDGGGGCICFAFRNEFVEGRIYARSCKKSGYNVPRNRESRMGYMKGGKIMKRIVVFVILYED